MCVCFQDLTSKTTEISLCFSVTSADSSGFNFWCDELRGYFLTAGGVCKTELRNYALKNMILLEQEIKFFFFFWLPWHWCLLVSWTHTRMYLCSETLRGYSDSISGRTPPSCGRSSEPRRAAGSSTGTAWEPEPGSSRWTRATPGRRAERRCWSHLCTTHTARRWWWWGQRRKNRIKSWMRLWLAHWVGS